jgi:hypothetical protein
MSGDFSYLSRRAVLVIALLFSLAGCAHRYTVCIRAGDIGACRAGYTKHDARVAAETLGSLPGVDSATVERTPKHDRQTKSGAADVLD